MIRLSSDLVALVLTLLIPVVTGVLTRSTASDRIKAATAIVLAAVVALITEARADDGAAVLSTQMIYTWVIALAVQLASYFGIYKPITPTLVGK